MQENLLDINKFTLEELVAKIKKSNEEYKEEYIALRRKKASLPDAYYNNAEKALTASYLATIEPAVTALQHYKNELISDLEVGCEMKEIDNEQVRSAALSDYIDLQKVEKRWLPWRYRWRNHVWFAMKLVFWPITLTYYVLIVPGKIRDVVKRIWKSWRQHRREQNDHKNEWKKPAGTHANPTIYVTTKQELIKGFNNLSERDQGRILRHIEQINARTPSLDVTGRAVAETSGKQEEIPAGKSEEPAGQEEAIGQVINALDPPVIVVPHSSIEAKKTTKRKAPPASALQKK